MKKRNKFLPYLFFLFLTITLVAIMLNKPTSAAIPVGVSAGTCAAGVAAPPWSTITPFGVPSASPVPPSCNVIVITLSPSLLSKGT